MFILYGLYFDGIDNVDDEHVGDFDAFFPGHSHYLVFSFDGGGLDVLYLTTRDGTSCPIVDVYSILYLKAREPASHAITEYILRCIMLSTFRI